MSDPTSESDDIICQCYQVPESVIRRTIAEKNLTTIDEITESCEAGGGCHSCHILLQLFLDQHHQPSRPMETVVAEHADKVSKKGILSRFFSKIKSSD